MTKSHGRPKYARGHTTDQLKASAFQRQPLMRAIIGAKKYFKPVTWHGTKQALQNAFGGSSTGVITKLKSKDDNVGTAVKPTLEMVHGKRAEKFSSYYIASLRKALASPNYFNLQTSLNQPTTAGLGYYTPYLLTSTADMLSINGYVAAASANRFSISNAKLSLTISNATNSNCFVRLYEFVLRHDIPSALTSIQNLVQTLGWPDGLTSSTKIQVTDVNGTLFNNPKFIAYCKVEKVRVLEFAPGQQQLVELIDNEPHNCLSEILTSSPMIGIRGVTRGIVIQQWGGLCNDSVTPTIVTTSPTSLDFMANYRYEYTWMSDVTYSSNSTNNLGTIAAVAETENPLTGVSQAYTAVA
jgi:hypothetical protein